MSTQEEQIKAAIVIYGDEIAIIDPEVNGATEVACRNLHKFVDYVQTLDPLLERHEAIVMTAAILDGLPALLETDQDLIAGLKAECRELRNHRQ
ncbi:hypothetical protein NIES4072_18540 [Nostoc commune NIES-4072]|uniref:Uncharacterized protein n=1 Tax=Nostoc commune NIES-4072 TaxID=2005467 RepID=A0A2R5FHR3_NOSCO|nr:hypothetical protein [Nostoc commune]BBD64484.1 hypothetical protein NIES4070_08270 [Nostoc commune HK-02]GBG18190.1 hypothetical protein NIES4072_18540 [Nostoc commune NIES-4072]